MLLESLEIDDEKSFGRLIVVLSKTSNLEAWEICGISVRMLPPGMCQAIHASLIPGTRTVLLGQNVHPIPLSASVLILARPMGCHGLTRTALFPKTLAAPMNLLSTSDAFSLTLSLRS